MSDAQFIPKAVELVKEAVELDNNDDLEKALPLYKKALEYFITGMKYEKNEKSKQAIRAKIKEYMDRAEAIQAFLDDKQKAAAKGSAKDKDKGAKDKGKGAKDKDKDKDSKDNEKDEKDPETAKLEAALQSAIVSEKPNVKWDDVAGLETAKGLLKEAVILPVKFPQLFQGKRKPWKGILLYGPPGTGKSYLAKAVATEAASTFLSVSSSDLVSKFQGESERLVKTLFEMARKQSPAIIFIDEIDSLCSNRGDGENESARRIKTEFLVQMQGVGKGNDGVLVLGATNTPWELDPAIRRRFEKRVYIPLPEAPAREQMFKIHLGNTPHNLKDSDFATLAEKTEWFSGSDIQTVVRDALYEPVRICQAATHFLKVPDEKQGTLYLPCSPMTKGAIEMSLFDIPAGLLKPPDLVVDDFLKVLRNARPTVGKEDLVRVEEWTSQYGQEG